MLCKFAEARPVGNEYILVYAVNKLKIAKIIDHKI
jgi:hypothetical protein